MVYNVANISDHVDAKTAHWSDLGIAQYYQFQLTRVPVTDSKGEDFTVVIKGRESTAGDETFRGLFKHAHMSCSEHTEVFDKRSDHIDWSSIPDGQLADPCSEKTLKEYKKTIGAGWHQWNYTEEQFESLRKLYELMASNAPLPFHWYDEKIPGPGEPYTLLPFKKTASIAQSNALMSLDSDSEYDPTCPLATRGPGAPISGNSFDPVACAELRSADSKMGFQLGTVVVIRPSACDEGDDGFWLGKICETPALQEDEYREEDETYVGIHWYDKKAGCRDRQWNWRQCKWEGQMTGTGSEKRDHIEAQPIKVVGCELKLNTDGSINKQSETGLQYLNFYRRMWFELPPCQWVD